MPSRRAPRPLAAALNATLGEVEPETLLASVQTVWAGVVGEAIAAEATPVAEREGVVTVACDSATWAQELDLLSGQILAQLRSELPSEAPLRGLRFNAARDPGR
jgi:predicted nucleic acid-binding Zn ribbon protein